MKKLNELLICAWIIILTVLALRADAHTITIETPYLIGDYVHYAGSSERHIKSGEGVVVGICTSEDELYFEVIVSYPDRNEIISGVTLGMIQGGEMVQTKP